jgi:hypothetical protein
MLENAFEELAPPPGVRESGIGIEAMLETGVMVAALT